MRKKRSSQAKANDTITANQANVLPPGSGGGGSTQGTAGATGQPGNGVAGGIAIFGTATIDNTSITGNSAPNGENDVLGTFKT